jgi:hypothetical protein
MKNPFTSIAIALLAATFATTGFAQTMYRCGSTYQDRPCEGGQKSTKIIGSASPATSSNGGVTDAGCIQQGAQAQRIVWSREGGAMLDQQLAKAGSESERQLVSDVYARRGTSSDIRAAIEADCVAAKARAAQSPAAAQAPNKSATPDQSAIDAAKAKERAEQENASKKMQCDRVKKEIGDVASSQRTGGNAAQMEEFSQNKRELDRMLKEAGCP